MRAEGGTTDHVIIVTIDGLRPDAIDRFQPRTLGRLIREGAWTFDASTVIPSRTLPAHTSLLTGMGVESHGVTWNTEELDTHGHVMTPTIFTAAKAAGLRTAVFFGKSKLAHLAVPEALDHARVPMRWPGRARSQSTVGHVKRHLRTARPNLMLVHLLDPDFIGHMFGWMSMPYGWAVASADAQLGELIDVADAAFGAGNYTLLVTADHGGSGRDHPGTDPRDLRIPWIAWGEGVAAGTRLPAGITMMDNAATALWLLGIDVSDGIAGRVVTAAFDAR